MLRSRRKTLESWGDPGVFIPIGIEARFSSVGLEDIIGYSFYIEGVLCGSNSQLYMRLGTRCYFDGQYHHRYFTYCERNAITTWPAAKELSCEC